ncbi:stalk domain-containing protein [Paenibacillus wenxiniae]|uniref:Stalk domain-containing protein n=1 Tax=Paenibacillus wenxiniae TaxID=1636843 RepID=A0ABW4RQ05_9BACL
MKKKLTIAAIVAGMGIMGATGVYAGTNLQQIKAALNYGIGIEVNGQAYTAKDANGKTLAPITYNGTTYLPVRAIGEALNTPIAYDAAASKVKIGSTGASSSSTSGSSSTSSTGTSNVQRPQHIPADFPIPADAKVFDVIESSKDGVKSVVFSYLTKQGLEQIGNNYKQYFVSKGATKQYEEIKSDGFTVIDSGSNFSVTATGQPGKGDKQGFNEVNIIWQGQ